MRTHKSSCEALDRMQAAFADTDPRTAERRSTISSNSATRPEHDRSFAPDEQMLPTLRNALATLLTDISHSLVSSKLGKMVDRMRGSSTPRNEPLAMVELESSGESLAWLLALLNKTVLRVGPLELDLIDRAAKRGDRHIDLRPREFQLLKYMMQRSDKVLSRATLLKEVWHYKILPQTNLVDVHMGRLRRKIDGANEAPMMRNVRGVGFVLDAAPLSQGSAKKHDDEIAASRVPATAFSLATLIAMTGSEDVGTPPRQRGLVYSHGGADCSFKSRAQCEAACALDQGAECYQDDGEVDPANSSSPGTQLQLSKYQTPTSRKGELS